MYFFAKCQNQFHINGLIYPISETVSCRYSFAFGEALDQGVLQGCLAFLGYISGFSLACTAAMALVRAVQGFILVGQISASMEFLAWIQTFGCSD